jgi:hypothetical protein
MEFSRNQKKYPPFLNQRYIGKRNPRKHKSAGEYVISNPLEIFIFILSHLKGQCHEISTFCSCTDGCQGLSKAFITLYCRDGGKGSRKCIAARGSLDRIGRTGGCRQERWGSVQDVFYHIFLPWGMSDVWGEFCNEGKLPRLALAGRRGRRGVHYVRHRCLCDHQCCGSGMFIPDPTFFYPGSASKNFKYLNPQKMVSKL